MAHASRKSLLRASAFALVAMAGFASSAIAPAAAQSADAPIKVQVPSAAAANAAANVNITPRRVIFDRNKRAEAVYLFNQGTAPVTVDVALVDNVMLETGEIVPLSQVAEKGDAARESAAHLKSAASYLLAVPSRLTLAPGQGKTVRVRALLPDGDEPVEYRSHLTVTTVPPPDSGLTADQAAAASRGELVLRVQTIFGLSIPLIVRTGPVVARAEILDLGVSTERQVQALAFDIARSGTASLYGNVEVRDAKNQSIGLVRGLGVYTEIARRHCRVELLRPLRKGEAITVTYKADDGSTLAKSQITAP